MRQLIYTASPYELDRANVADFIWAWFHYRVEVIDQTAGGNRRMKDERRTEARVENAESFAAMYLVFCATEFSDGALAQVVLSAIKTPPTS
ncbi:MAG: hypothetical protein WDM88_13185 [Galbitalea sp.]